MITISAAPPAKVDPILAVSLTVVRSAYAVRDCLRSDCLGLRIIFISMVHPSNLRFYLFTKLVKKPLMLRNILNGSTVSKLLRGSRKVKQF